MKFPADSSVTTVVNALSSHQDELDSAMSVLHAEGLVTADDVGNWDAGKEFAGTAGSAHQHVLAVYREFQRQLEEVVRLLAKSDHSHSAAEEASRKASQQAGAPLDIPRGVPTQQTAPSKD
jgi:precorrin-4 methylase